MPERVTTNDKAALHALLDAVPIGHFGFVEHSSPVVMPNAFVRDNDDILMHGSTGSWWLRKLSDGREVSASVSILEGLVYARSGFESSMQYKSAVLFGRCVPLKGVEKARALDLVVDGLLPKRLSELRPATKKELAATLLLKMRIDEWSFKSSIMWPEDPEEDIASDAWAGFLPIVSRYGDPENSPDLRPGIPLAASVARLRGSKTF